MKHDWEKKFDEIHRVFCTHPVSNKHLLESNKAFIRTLLASEEARVRGEIAEQLQGMLWAHEGNVGAAPRHRLIHNDAIREVISLLTPPPAQQYSTRIVDEMPAVDWSEPTNEDIDKAVSLLPQSKGECYGLCQKILPCSDDCICPCHKEAAERGRKDKRPYHQRDHVHCFDGQEEHGGHLKCCLCLLASGESTTN